MLGAMRLSAFPYTTYELSNNTVACLASPGDPSPNYTAFPNILAKMFGAKRKARKIGQDEDDEGRDIDMTEAAEDGAGKPIPVLNKLQMSDSRNRRRLTARLEPKPTLARPSSTSRSSSKAKRKSTLRTSFGPSGTSMTEDDGDDAGTAIITPKKTSLSRQALEKHAARKSLAASLQSEQIPLRQTTDRPSYSADALNELKSSTPSAPKDLKFQTDVVNTVQDIASNGQSRDLDLAAKFGANLAFPQDAAIPTDAEIREKKERRARLAKEHEYISLNDDGEEAQPVGDDSDDEFKDRSILQRYAEPKPSKYEETRLVRDDEDIAEGFENFVEDGRIALGRKAEKEQKKRHAAEMREAIERAEGGSDDDSSEDESEAERNAAYEAAQTRAGMDGLRKEEGKGAKARRPRTPPKITPLPSLAACAERLKGELERKRVLKEQRSRRLEEVRQELEDIAVRKVEVQRLLNEAGERYQRLRAEAGDVKVEEAVERDVFAHERGELGSGSEDVKGQLTAGGVDWDDPPKRMGLGMGT